MAQLFKQLLAVASIVKDKVGKNEVKTVGFDLTDHFCRITRAVHCGDTE